MNIYFYAQALRHPWVLNGGPYPGSSGSGSDGSEFSNGASAARTDGFHDSDVPAPRLEPDPQNIPSELLGDDSDTEDEREQDGHLERKDAREDYRPRGGGGVGTSIRGSGAVGGPRRNRRILTPDVVARGQVDQAVGHVATIQPQQSPSHRMSPDATIPPLPPSAAATPVAAFAAAASNEMPTATAVVIGVVAEERIGEPGGGSDPVAVSAETGTVTVAAENLTSTADDAAADTGANTASGGTPAAVGARGLGGIREEDSLHESDVEVDNDGGGPGVKAAPSVSQGDTEQRRESCIPEPAPPPLPPTTTRASVPKVSGGTGGGGKKETDVDLLAGRVNRISLLRAAAAAVASVGGGSEGVVGAAAEIARVLSGAGAASMGKKKTAATGSGGGGAAASGNLGDGEIAGVRGATTSSIDVAAEAAEEEASAARQAAANKTAVVAAGLLSNTAKRTDASAEPPSNPPSPATPIQRRGSPSGGGSRPRMLDVFSSPPLAPVGAGRGAEDEESGFALDSGCPPLPPKNGRARSSSGREGLPPLGAEHRLAAVGVGGLGGQRPPSTGGGPLSLGVAGMAMEGAAGDGGEVRREGEVVGVAPPAFHDLVKRSTRFMTSGELSSSG